MAYQEITKQQNIEAVADNAYEELECLTSVSSESVNPDWMFRFFNSVEDISNEDMQKIWGHILAGEIKSPNTYSYRTLEKIKNMTQQEAEHFQLVSSLAIHNSNTYFVLSDEEIMNKHNVYFKHILELEECGLMTAHTLSLTLTVSSCKAASIHNSNILGLIHGKVNKSQEIVISVYVFTESGCQLMQAISPQVNQKYMLDCLKLIRNNNKDFTISAHNINFIDDEGKINYNKTNILLPEDGNNLAT